MLRQQVMKNRFLTVFYIFLFSVLKLSDILINGFIITIQFYYSIVLYNFWNNEAYYKLSVFVKADVNKL